MKISIDNTEYEYEKKSNKTILEFLKEKNEKLNYECQDGYCGSCRCKLISGEVEKNINDIGYHEEDEVLICTSKPKTNISLKRI